MPELCPSLQYMRTAYWPTGSTEFMRRAGLNIGNGSGFEYSVRCGVVPCEPVQVAARAFVAQIGERVVAVMPIAPVDFDTSRLRDCDVFRVGGGR